MCAFKSTLAGALIVALFQIAAGPAVADQPQPDPADLSPAVTAPTPDLDAIFSNPLFGSPLGDRPHPLAARRDHEVESIVIPIDDRSDEAVVSGYVFYNDQRKYGNHSWRQDKTGNPASACRGCSEHWVAAYCTVVDVIELPSYRTVGSTTVSSSGNFYVRLTSPGGVRSYFIRVRLRFNGEDYAFSIGPGRDDFYALYYYQDDPLRLGPGDEATNRTLFFQLASSKPGAANDYSIAVNHYASLVDVILTLHRDNGIPFFRSKFGRVQVEFPSNQVNVGATKSATRICLGEKSDFPTGELVAHEYGHVVHLRAWDGTYGWPGIGYGWTVGRAQEPRVAFKEGWAEFIARVGLATYQSSDTSGPQGTIDDGYRWVGNVERMFIDWIDTANDDESGIAGPGDHFSATLYSTWKNLRNMPEHVDEYGGDWKGGLDVCDYLRYYLYVRKSVQNVGKEDHERKVETISDLAYNNNISCGLPHPGTSGKRGFALVKLTDNGSFDGSFGNMGYAVTDLAGATNERTGGAALTPGGRIVVAGTASSDGQNCLVLLQYTRSGQLTPDFGQGGVVLQPIKDGSNLTINSVHADGSGAITVAGSLTLGHEQFFVARFDNEGRLRTDTFNVDGDHPGWTTIEIHSGCDSRAYGVTSAGADIIVAGYVDRGSMDKRFAVARLYSGGGLNWQNFSNDGIAVTDFSSLEDEVGRDVVLHSDGRILVGGYGKYSDGGSPRFAIACYHANGNLDSGWSSDGKSAPNYEGLQRDYGQAIAVDNADRVVIAGYGGTPDSYSNPYNHFDFLLRRYDSAGQYDDSFGDNGWATASFDDDGAAYGTSVACDRNNRIVVAGHVGVDHITRFAAARFTTTGSPDATFSGDGRKVADFGSDVIAELAKVLIDEDGGVYLIGHAR